MRRPGRCPLTAALSAAASAVVVVGLGCLPARAAPGAPLVPGAYARPPGSAAGGVGIDARFEVRAVALRRLRVTWSAPCQGGGEATVTTVLPPVRLWRRHAAALNALGSAPAGHEQLALIGLELRRRDARRVQGTFSGKLYVTAADGSPVAVCERRPTRFAVAHAGPVDAVVATSPPPPGALRLPEAPMLPLPATEP